MNQIGSDVSVSRTVLVPLRIFENAHGFYRPVLDSLVLPNAAEVTVLIGG